MDERERAWDVLFQDLAEARVIDLDVRLQRREGDVEVSDPTLEQETDVPSVVGPGSPYALRWERCDAVPHVHKSISDASHRRLADTVGTRSRRGRMRLAVVTVFDGGKTPAMTMPGRVIPCGLQDVNDIATNTSSRDLLELLRGR